ncbi:MAG TPA: beta-propeller domain-containing protein [Phycisphaerae bacterium]|nr:beta-propeller domain-containing protein [Phycisphaerae bacterium]
MLRRHGVAAAEAVAAQRDDGLSFVLLIVRFLLVAALAFGVVQLLGCASATGGGAGGEADIGGEGEGEVEEPEPSDVVREIEEADIVKFRDGYFYLANRYRGLVIVDARTIERPEIVGRVPMQGRAVELYADADRAYIVTSADFYRCAGSAVSFAEEEEVSALLNPGYDGSRITVVDITDPNNPVELNHFDLDGFTSGTRRVGDVIYAAGNLDVYGSGPPSGVGTSGSGDTPDGVVSTNGEGTIAPPSSTGLAVMVDGTGAAVATATSPGGVTAEISLAGAVPGEVLQVTVADGNTRPGALGLPDDSLPITVSGGGDLTGGGYTAVVSVEIPFVVVNEAGLTVDELLLYRYDASSGVWLPAATNDQGNTQPTGGIGDYGHYLQPAEDFHVVWAVVDLLGDFAVGPVATDVLTIEIMEQAGGSIVVAPDQPAYAVGTTVTITAVPDEGYQFAGWVTGEQSPALPTANPVQIVLAQDLEVGAVFEPVDFSPRVFVVSINVADPNDIRIVDRVDVTGESLDIQVTTNAIYVLGNDPDMYDTSRVTYVDISDRAGDVEQRDTFRVPGLVGNRFFADEYDGVFRIVTGEVSTGKVAIYLYDVADPDDVERIGQRTIITGESLRSVRFDGTRGYAVTFQQIDPLFVLDLSDPENPEVTGELEVPGWSTHLVPLGDRLIGVGFDDTAGFRPAVALYSVVTPTQPFQLNRIVLGEKWSFDTTSEATVDEKALKVLEEDGLILVPFSSWDQERGEYVDSLQLIDLGERSLTERGFVEHRGLVRRAGVIDQRLWVLSDEALQVADIDDRDAPESIATEEIMSEQDLLDAGLSECMDSARWSDFQVPFGFEGGFFDFVVLEPYGYCGAGAGMIGLLGALLGLSLMRLSRGRWR